MNEVRDDKADDRLENDGGDGEQHRLFDDHPECIASEQKLKIAEANELCHRLVQGRQMYRIKCRVDHQAGDDRDQRQRHEERDRRFATRKSLQRGLPLDRGNPEVTYYDVRHPSAPFSLTPVSTPPSYLILITVLDQSHGFFLTRCVT